MITLSRWFEVDPRGGALVAFGREGARSAADLRRDVAALAARLAPARGAEVLLHCDDAYAFAVGLLAIAHAGARAGEPGAAGPEHFVTGDHAAFADTGVFHLLGSRADRVIKVGEKRLSLLDIEERLRALEELIGAPPQLAALEALKFHDVLLPRQEALLRVELQDQERFEFSLRDAERPERSFASGRGRLEPRR